ncbi:hypothetical protein [Paeniglutamicibacter sp.]|uniref:hypothetical protein n=1 Tax=Paeniglutamicibacter sp. TaxID=1934391 RepID=UPI003988C3B3
MKTELPQGFILDNDHPPDGFTRGLGPASGDEGQPGAVESIWTPDRGIVLEITTNDDGELSIDQARKVQANLGRVLEALDALGH